MTPEEQRIAIAKVCGYTDEGPNCPPGKFRENIFNADASHRNKETIPIHQMKAHDLAQLLLQGPNDPVKFLDYDGLIMNVTGIREEHSLEFYNEPVVQLEIEFN